MNVILGASGKVGRATIAGLHAAGQPVRAVLRRPVLAAAFEAMGCETAIADFTDAAALRRAMTGATQVQVISPVAGQVPAAGDVMRQQIDLVASILQETQPAHVLAISDYGAEQSSGTGVTLIFRHLEKVLGQLPSRVTFLRSSEQMQNWARVVGVAARSGQLPSFHQPLEKMFPSVAAQDVGAIAAELLLAKPDAEMRRIIHVEGPARYSALDVATSLTQLLGRPVTARALPPADWRATLVAAGLSDSYASLVIELFTAHNAGLIDAESAAGPIRRGTTTLHQVLTDLVHARG